MKATQQAASVISDVELAHEMLKKTASYTCGNIEIVRNDHFFRVYSSKTGSTCFFEPHLAAMFNATTINCYVDYDRDREQCYLHVF